VNKVDQLLLQSFGSRLGYVPRVFTFYTQTAYGISTLSRTLTLVTSSFIQYMYITSYTIHYKPILRIAIALPVICLTLEAVIPLSAVSYSFTVNGLQFNEFWWLV